MKPLLWNDVWTGVTKNIKIKTDFEWEEDEKDTEKKREITD